jgi:predicted acetyltransferase
MTVERIFTRTASSESQTEHQFVRVVAGSGIEGDRYFARQDEPGQNVTFIEAEEIESFFAEQQCAADLSATGRNLITRGVRLNELVGTEFLVGTVRFRGVELCEPCLGLGQALATSAISPPNVVKRLVHRAGLRADALSSGEVALGAKFQPIAMELVRPAEEHVASYVAALERGWSADNIRGAVAAQEELERIRADVEAFLRSMDDRDAKGPAVKLPDGSFVPRLPGFRRWLWDGEFAGSIGLRWQPGTAALPPHCLGHIGYAVVPWKQRRGYATAALRAMLVEAHAVGLPYVEITTDPDNLPSCKVIEAVGGTLHETFIQPPQFGCKPGLRYRVALV